MGGQHRSLRHLAPEYGEGKPSIAHGARVRLHAALCAKISPIALEMSGGDGVALAVRATRESVLRPSRRSRDYERSQFAWFWRRLRGRVFIIKAVRISHCCKRSA